MAENSKIEWTDHTVNFVIGCVEVSPACKNCYAKLIDSIFKFGGATHWGIHAPRYMRIEAAKVECLRLNRKAASQWRKDKVFINSMSDTFEGLAELDESRRALFEMVEKCGSLIFMLLTKRPENVLRMIPSHWRQSIPDNVWIGTTVENQEYADKRIPELLKIPAKVRFLSCEPLLGPIEFSDVSKRPDAVSQLGKKALDGIHWVISGGESGPNARPSHPDWHRSLRDQCQAAGVPFLFKQWGEWIPWEWDEQQFNDVIYSQNGKELWHDDAPRDICNLPKGWQEIDITKDCTLVQRVGKKAAGRLLDGKEWSEFPEVKR